MASDTAATPRKCCATVGGEPHTVECEATWRATRDFPPLTTWAWVQMVPALLLEDPPMVKAAVAQAVARARSEGLEAVGDPRWEAEPLSEVGVAMMATVETEDPDSPWHGMPAEVIEAEVESRERAARNMRTLRVELDVRPLEETRELRELAPWAADEVARQGLEALRTQDENAAGLVCGEPRNRHDFLPRVAEMLRDGRVQSARCQKCGRDVGRDELIGQAEAEARGERWWE